MADQVVRDIAVQQDKTKYVSDAKDRILLLFNVVITLIVPESAGIQWVQLKGRREDTELAQNYINSLCKPDIKTNVLFPERFFEAISNFRNHVEKTSGAVVLFSSRNEARVQGSDIAVVLASSAIDERVKELEAGQIGLPPFLDLGTISERRRVETKEVQSTPVPSIAPSLEEFAIKLGYTREDIHQVVKQQGKEVDQNTLLQELIKVSAPSLLQRARPDYSLPQSASTVRLPSRRSDIVARGAPAIPRAWPQETTAYGSVQPSARAHVNDRPEEDVLMYKQVIGDSASVDVSSDLRRIVIDGSNVAMSHGNQQCFSCMGIKICVDFFKQKGHKDITVFVPQWRKETPRHDSPMRNQEILAELEQQRHLVFTPSRRVNGRRIVCYDDRFVVRLAAETEGIIVSNDHFRDLFNENPKWQEAIEQRILMYSFVNDIFMIPDDPLGRHGPKLDDFLRKGTATHRRVCPYLKKCTYGLRCRFYHPERDPSRKESDAKKNERLDSQYRLRAPDNSHLQRSQEIPRGYAGTQHYNPNSYIQHHQPSFPRMPNQQASFRGMVREDQTSELVNSSNPATSDFNDGPKAETLRHLESIYPDCRDIIIQVMNENPGATVAELADRISDYL